MKKLTLVTIIFFCTFWGYSQKLLKDIKREPDGFLVNKIGEELRNQLDPEKVPTCYHQEFFVKFKLNEKGEVFDINVSANMVDKVVINIVQTVIKENENLWDIGKCKKYNPSLAFLLPIDLNIFKPSCDLAYSREDVLKSRYDFAAMLKYNPIEKKRVECIFCDAEEKFVGMVLNPIFVNNGKF
jgi:hypothetical protein